VLAIELFDNPPSLDALMADLPPLSSVEDLAIPDLTDEEWEAFVEALKTEGSGHRDGRSCLGRTNTFIVFGAHQHFHQVMGR
jgi:hypothetical protein